MHKTFKYRLYPTKSQARLLDQTLDECRWVYNHLLEQRKSAWEDHKETLGYYDQSATLPGLKMDRPTLKTVQAQVIQNVAVRIDLAFKAFFRRVKTGESPGYPRFKGAGCYDSFTYPQAPVGCKLVGNRLHLAKIGSVRVVLHRPLQEAPKTVTVRRSSTGKWYASFCCEWEPTPLPVIEPQVGIDVGLTCFATFSDGRKISNPRFFRNEERALATVQRRFQKVRNAKIDRRTKQYQKAKKAVGRVHERATWRRKNFAHQESRRIVNEYQVIAVEDLAVNRMVLNHCLAKSILDAAWSEFSELLRVKAEWAARSYVAINPAYTTQDCSACRHRQVMPLAERVYRCPCCGLVLGRDHNAALNILTLGLQRLGIQSVKAGGPSPCGEVTWSVG